MIFSWPRTTYNYLMKRTALGMWNRLWRHLIFVFEQPFKSKDSWKKGSYPGKDWWSDFTCIPETGNIQYPLLVDTFTCCVGRCPSPHHKTEMATEITKKLISEIVCRVDFLQAWTIMISLSQWLLIRESLRCWIFNIISNAPASPKCQQRLKRIQINSWDKWRSYLRKFIFSG